MPTFSARSLTLLLPVLLLAGCAAPMTSPSTPQAAQTTATSPESNELDQLLASFELSGLSTTEVINKLDATKLADREADLRASIRPGEVLFSSAQAEELPAPIPSDTFYLSFAPYISQTHECYFHSLTTCVGELGNEEFHVKVVDSNGTVLVDEARTSFDNGFIGLWLPRGIEGELTVELDGKVASTEFSTVADDAPTCLTTLKLS